MDIKSKRMRISLLSGAKFLGLLLALAGALLVGYGCLDGMNFEYAFMAEHFADSSYQPNLLLNGTLLLETMRTREPSSSNYQWALARLTTPYSMDYYTLRPDGEVLSTIGDVEDVRAHFTSLPSHIERTVSDGGVVYVGLSHETYEQVVADYDTKRESGTRNLYVALGGLLMFLLGTGYVLYTAGNVADSEEIKLSFIDTLYLDVALVVFGGIFTLCIWGLQVQWWLYHETGTSVALTLGATLITLAALSALTFGTMVVKRLKRRELFKHTLVVSLFAWAIGLIRSLLDKTARQAVRSGSTGVRAALMLIGYSVTISFLALLLGFASNARSPLPALTLITLIMATGVLALLYVNKQTAAFQAVLTGTRRIRSGELAHRISAQGCLDLVELADNINNMAAGLATAVSREVKSERMKAELITNVSHDLKTPLTSIISYVGLLRTEGLNSENAAKYLDVLELKSLRLKSLTEDLFEAAKASSGNMAVTPERIDVDALLRQGLGEMSDRIAEANLDFRLESPPHELFVQADGKLLWRAIENLLTNALKYSLPGSRVYISAHSVEGKVQVTIKNISATALNIPAEELFERFKRGDESRSTEGSGLGLSIAKSLVELQKGQLHIDIDGDLFKATIMLPLS